MPRSLWQRLQSRKFLLIVAAIILIVTMALNGEITWAQAVYWLVPVVLGYLGVEGAADVASILKRP